jgi:hypothetical protein
VKLRSRSPHFSFTAVILTGLLLSAVAPTLARADRVVVYALGGPVSGDRRDHIEEAVLSAVRALGHTVVTPTDTTVPATAGEMDGIAIARTADYILIPRVDGTMPGQYRLHLTVGHAGRVEDLVVNVTDAEEVERLADVLGAMLRPAGLGDDALRLSGMENDAERAAREAAEAARAAEEAARLAADADAARAEADRIAAEEEAARLAAEEEERRRAEEEAAAARATEEERWNARPVYGSDGAWMVLGGVQGGGFAAFSRACARCEPVGGLATVNVRIARLLIEGLELRGGADLMLGAITALDLQVGAAYLFSPFAEPIYLGASAEVGVSFLFTGPRDVGFLFRVNALLGWRPTQNVYLEVALPEIGVMTNGENALLFGASVRVGYRFN